MNNTDETFTGVMEVTESRTALGEKGKVVWGANDSISIFKKSGYHQKYQVENGGGVEATFKYAGKSSKHGLDLTQNYAVYPYSANHTLTAEGVFTLDLSSLATQNYTEGSFENGKSVMTAKSDDTNLFFYNALSMICFKLWSVVPGDYSIKSITLTSASAVLNGIATVKMSAEQPVAEFTSGTKEITLTCAEAVQLETEGSVSEEGVPTGGHDFYMLVPAGTYGVEDLTIKIEGTDANGKALVYEVKYPTEEKGALELNRSEIFTIYKEFTEETWTGSIETGWDGTSTTPVEEQSDVYEITTPAELAWVADQVNSGSNTFSGKTVKLMNNIDLSNEEWTPIGLGKNYFKGTFEGGNNTISNLKFTERKSGNDQAALFGSIAGTVTIKNLTVSNAQILYPSDGDDFYGAAVVGTAYGNVTLENINVINSTIQGNNKVAGILAHDGSSNSLSITNCHVSGSTIESKDATDGGNVGGLVGLIQTNGATITNSSVKNCTINAINSSDSGKRSNSQLLGTIIASVKKENFTVNISGCTVSGNTFTETGRNTYVSPYGDGTLIGGYRDDDDSKYYAGMAIIDGTYYVSTVAQLTYVVSNGATSLYLAGGNYTMPTAVQEKTLTISGSTNTKINVTSGLTYIDKSNITFNGVTILSKQQGEGYKNGFADAKYTVFNKCVIEGTLGLDYSCEFNDCVFNITGNYYNLWTWGAGTVSFTRCTFNCEGKALLVYANVLDNNSNHQTVNITECKFYDKGNGDVSGKAAVEITNTYTPIRTYDVIIKNYEIEGFDVTVPDSRDFNTAYGSVEDGKLGTTLWGNKCQLSNEYLNVEVNGVDEY